MSDTVYGDTRSTRRVYHGWWSSPVTFCICIIIGDGLRQALYTCFLIGWWSSPLPWGCLPLPSNSKPKRAQQWDPLGSLTTQTVNVVITSAALEREKENVNEKRGTLSWVQGMLSQGERAGGWVWMQMAMLLGVRERLWAHPVIQISPSRFPVALPFYLLPFSAASPHLD